MNPISPPPTPAEPLSTWSKRTVDALLDWVARRSPLPGAKRLAAAPPATIRSDPGEPARSPAESLP